MGWISGYFFGNEEEVKIKQLQVIFGIEDYEEARKLFYKVETDLGHK